MRRGRSRFSHWRQNRPQYQQSYRYEITHLFLNKYSPSYRAQSSQYQQQGQSSDHFDFLNVCETRKDIIRICFKPFFFKIIY